VVEPSPRSGGEPAILVLVLEREAPPPPPEELPIARAATRLAEEGCRVIFGQRVVAGRASGLEVYRGQWREVIDVPVRAAHDRFPSQTWPGIFARAREGLGEIPLGNPFKLTMLCRDKLACQRVLEAAGVPMPPVEGDPARFPARMAEWGAAFLKPRHGAMGRGVSRVGPGDDLPARGPGARRGEIDELILQRAVPPPEGWAGLAVRALFQRQPASGWYAAPPVARLSAQDPVANVARGAVARPAAEVLAPGTLARIHELGLAACRALALGPGGPRVLELGLDFVVDPAGAPHLIEVNSRPRGRLEALAERDPSWAELHVEACARPLRYLAWLTS
jgi:glutathione synthase/RimK-type ligase-like ATP-grasp enzyme